MTKALTAFATSQSGAVMVNWVVIIAGALALCLAAMAVIGTGMSDISGEMQTTMAASDPRTSFDDPILGNPDVLAE